MKKTMKIALTLMLVLSLFISAMPSGLASDGYDEWLAYCCIIGPAWHPIRRPEEFHPWLVNRNFPTYVLRNVTNVCQSRNGTPVNALAIDLSGGVNLRSTPDYYVNNNIVHKVHGDETVYIYFRLYGPNGREWYYGVTSGGIEGYMYAERIQLVYD